MSSVIEDAQVRLTITRGPAGAALVAARGELDGFTGPAMLQELMHLIASGYITLTLDLTDLTFMDSSGHRSLRSVADQAESAGGELLLGECSPPVRRFLAITTRVLTAGGVSVAQNTLAAMPRPRAIGF